MTAAAATGWRARRERTTVLGVRLLLWLAVLAGRGAARLVIRVVALYYTLASPRARRAARAFLTRVGASSQVGFGAVHRQILRFAQVGLDALYLLGGRIDQFTITRTGYEHLARLREERRSAILLGAHLGSFYAMRAQGGEEGLPLYAVAYTRHARRINEVLEAIDPTSKTRVLQMGEGVDFMIKIRDLVEEGALIALLADRVHSSERAVEVEFLGQPALFPTGPFLLAATLRLPVYLTFGLYRDPDGYDLFCEPFADRIVLPRGRRQEALRALVARYAARLEHYCRLAPDNWFNFYDFWGEERESAGAT
ncbi:MAG: hypothetical protein ACFCGT_26425 [Sandaracinaceae bacterium]